MLHIFIFYLLLSSILSLHHLFVRVIFQVQNVWKLESGVDLVILECIKVEDDPLEMDNQNIRSFCNETSLKDINFLIASLTSVVINDRTLNHLLQALVQALSILNWKTEIVKVLKNISNVATRLTDKL